MQTKRIEPQDLCRQTMQMILDYPEHYKNDACWHYITAEGVPGHCWGGTSDQIINGLTIAEPSAGPFSWDRLVAAYGMDGWLLTYFTEMNNTLEDLQTLTNIFCDPIESLQFDGMLPHNYLLVLSRPDLTIPAAKLAIEKLHNLSGWRDGWAIDTIKANSRALAKTPDLKMLLLINKELSHEINFN